MKSLISRILKGQWLIKVDGKRLKSLIELESSEELHGQSVKHGRSFNQNLDESGTFHIAPYDTRPAI